MPKVLFTLVNLARLNLAGTMLGPEQGARLEAALRLDSLCVNENAPPPPVIPTSQQREQTDLRRSLSSIAASHDSRTVFVPEHRLREIQDKVRSRAISKLVTSHGSRSGFASQGIKHQVCMIVKSGCGHPGDLFTQLLHPIFPPHEAAKCFPRDSTRFL